MTGQEMPLDVLERLDKTVTRLEQVVYGAEEIGLPGMRREQERLRYDVDRLMFRKPKRHLWAAGYIAFVCAYGLAIKEVRTFFDIHPLFALVLAALLLGIAFVLFYGGFGWLDGEGQG